MNKRVFAIDRGGPNLWVRVLTAGLVALTVFFAFPMDHARAADVPPVLDTPVEQSVQEQIEEPVEVPVEQPAQEQVEEPVEAPVEQPAQEQVEEPVEAPVEQPAQEQVEEPVFQPFVYNGVPFANPGWIVSLTRNGSYTCSGSLVNAYWVLTAAHCVDDADASFRINVGGDYWYSGAQQSLTQVHIHPGFDINDISSVDLAMVKLDSPVTNVTLPVLASNPAWPVLWQDLEVLGWGITYDYSGIPDLLQKGDVWVESDSTGAVTGLCNAGWVAGSGYEDFCFGGISWACSGDSGGPLIGYDSPTHSGGPVRTIYGITSFGDSSGCSSAFWDPVAQPVGPHVSWIKSFFAKPTAGDEMFFYRDDGLFAYYDVRSNGSLGAKLSGGTGYTRNWSSITAVDVDGDSRDEMFFYRDDGLFAYYDVRSNGSLRAKLSGGTGYTRNWSSITGVDLGG